MFMAIIFVLFGVAAWVAVGVLLYFRRKSLGKREAMRRVETSSAADVAGMAPGSPVEVKGTLRCESPLESEMAGKTCAYYLSQVIREYQETERDADGDLETRRRSEVVASNEQFALFAVEDDSGAVGVRGEGAEVDALEVMDRFERDAGGAGSISLGGLTFNLGERERTIGYRHVESILPVDTPVYVLGAVQDDGEIGAPPPGEEEQGRFLISHRSEEQLEKKIRRDALILTLIALGLFVFGAIFIAVGVAAAAGVF
jgi:E3 ubiquitin ligase